MGNERSLKCYQRTISSDAFRKTFFFPKNTEWSLLSLLLILSLKEKKVISVLRALFPELGTLIISFKWNFVIRLFLRRKIKMSGWIKFHQNPYFKIKSIKSPSIIIGKGTVFNGKIDLRTRDSSRIFLGEDVNLDGPIRLVAAGDNSFIRLGKSCRLTPFTIINGGGNVNIGSGTIIGSHFTLNANTHDFKTQFPILTSGFIHHDISIGEDVWIGNNVSILPGAVVGNHCVIGAQSLVNSKLPDWSISAGSPARVINTRLPNRS